MSWKVLADAGLVARVEPVLEAIYGVLEGSRWLPVGDLPPSRQPSLAGGLAGQALFCAYYGHARGRPDAEETALALLEQSLVAAAEQPLAGGLYGGFSGVGWAVEHLAGRCYEAGEDATADSEQEIVAFLEGGAADFPWELIQGLSGLALYLLERPRPARPALLRVVDALEASARADERGLYWFTPAEWVPEPQREDSPAGQMNLGVAHGITGVLGLLACLELAGLGDPRLRHLSEGAVSWLLAHRLPAGGSSR
nr:lanthionine synthetase LanC family protein [Thermoanaerobaculia bacterium]